MKPKVTPGPHERIHVQCGNKVTSVRLRASTHTVLYDVQEEGCSTSTVFRGVGVAPHRLIYCTMFRMAFAWLSYGFAWLKDHGIVIFSFKILYSRKNDFRMASHGFLGRCFSVRMAFAWEVSQKLNIAASNRRSRQYMDAKCR